MKISGTSCAIIDYLYNHINFESSEFKKYLSATPGDGGLNPGHLVFVDGLVKFAGEQFPGILEHITKGKGPDTFNIGGPAIVAMINCAQLLEGKEASAEFYGATGDDEQAGQIMHILKKTPLKYEHYRKLAGRTPTTYVFSDPDHHDGKGERTFVNDIGAAWNFTPEHLGDSFFNADLCLFGGTALVPNIHDALTELLKKGNNSGCVNVVGTVFDFRNEQANPDKPWPLGASNDSYKYMDLLIVDHVEALKISGCDSVTDAIGFFKSHDLGAFVITNGPLPLTAYSNGKLFKEQDLIELPVSEAAGRDMELHPDSKGDTTGCGDNFCGGVMASIAAQLMNTEKGELDLVEACAWGVASGGFACFCMGGTYIESFPGEKLQKVRNYYREYREQIADVYQLETSSL